MFHVTRSAGVGSCTDGLTGFPFEVTKFKTLSRRAKSSRQAQLRQMKEELSEFMQGDDDDDVTWMLDCAAVMGG